VNKINEGNIKFRRVERDIGLTDRVANQLLDMITAQQIRPGDRLPPEREIGEALGVSRTVVREAIRSLSGKGVLSVRSGRGVVVTALENESVAESMRLLIQTRGGYSEDGPFSYEKIHEVREILEVRAAIAAAERATPADIEELRQAYQALVEADTTELASARDVEFHRTIARLTHNELYTIMLDSIGPLLLQIRQETLGEQARRLEALAYHKRILDAIERGDPKAAEAAMSDHLQDSANVWRSLGKGCSAKAGQPEAVTRRTRRSGSQGWASSTRTTS
jgi:GntR family transcriptional repressor for pyruvate dehydrogenase complex